GRGRRRDVPRARSSSLRGLWGTLRGAASGAGWQGVRRRPVLGRAGTVRRPVASAHPLSRRRSGPDFRSPVRIRRARSRLRWNQPGRHGWNSADMSPRVLTGLDYAPADPPDSRGHRLDLYLPEGDGPWPVLIACGGSAFLDDGGSYYAAELAPWFTE